MLKFRGQQRKNELQLMLSGTLTFLPSLQIEFTTTNMHNGNFIC